jgi:hypothetical protein
MDWSLLPGQCQYNGCTHHVNSNGSGRFCFTHGGRAIRSHALCSNLAQAGGRCIKHGYKKPTCIVDGCSKQHVAHGLCKRHGGHRLCNVINCTHHVFRLNMCQSHYSSANKTSTVNFRSNPVSTTTFSQTKSGTLTTNSGNATEIDIQATEGVRAYPWILIKYVWVCKCVSV